MIKNIHNKPIISRLRFTIATFIGIVLIIISTLRFGSINATSWKARMEFTNDNRIASAAEMTMTDEEEILRLAYQTINVTEDDRDHSSSKLLIQTALASSSSSSSSSAVAAHDDQDIDPDVERERCSRYKYNYSGRTTRRRIFWGSLLADDSWHVLSIAAMEYYGVLSTVALVESNTTQTLHPRTIRFPKGSKSLELLSSPLLWGPNTTVSIDYYYDPPLETRRYLEREDLQRDKILERWKANGMTHEDIGYLSDIDEVVSRDFLRALQICDVPEFVPGQDCINSKILAAAIVFEGSPKCLTKDRIWWHPDMVIGECVDQIGNRTLHPPVKRVLYPHGYNKREDGWWEINTTMGPLWDATDFRMTPSGSGLHFGIDGSHTAYHFHNFFDSIAVLRNKYETYGHPRPNAYSLPLSEIGEDLNGMVNCLTGRNSSYFTYTKISETLPGGYQSLKVPNQMPLAFQRAPKYPTLRHLELQKMLKEDERLHPPRPSPPSS